MNDAAILLLAGAVTASASGFLTYLATGKPASAGAVILGLLAVMLWLQMAAKMMK
jgi:hypothetical protein